MLKSRIKNFLLRFFPRFPLLVLAPASSPSLYLTFDDGPAPTVTAALLDLLKEQEIQASFFCIGKLIREEPDLARRIVSEGHLLANHSYNHQAFSKLSVREQLAEIDKTDTLIAQTSGHQNRFFRAPQGIWSAQLILMLRLKGKTPVHWNYDSNDYQQGPVTRILERFASRPVSNGDVILFHDDNMICVEALRHLLPEWKEKGFGFRRIDEA